MDCSLPGSSSHGILQARILEWVAIPFSKGSSQSRSQAQVSCIVGRFFTIWSTREIQNNTGVGTVASLEAQAVKNQGRMYPGSPDKWGCWFCPADGRNHRLCSVFRCCCASGVEQSPEHRVCSGWVPWSDRLEALFSDKWGYGLYSLPGHCRRSSREGGKVLFCLNSRPNSAPHVF